MKNRITQFLLRSLLCLVLLATGCAPLANLVGPSDRQGSSSGQDLTDDNDTTAVEPEETLNEELAALQNSGDWQQGSSPADEQVAGEGEQKTIDSVAAPRPKQKQKQIAYDFPVTVNKQVELYLNLFQNQERQYFERWLSRSGKYLPMILEELEKADLPLDLAYLAMIESGFNPSAYSRAGAAGLWQFISSTGRHYGLQINSWVDERRDPVKSTRAAIAYLGKLHDDFQDWSLAVAAYNAGEGKMQRAIDRYNSKDFWQIARNPYLSLETKRYVPKLIAAIIIAKNPEKYGFGDTVIKKPGTCDIVDVPPLTNLTAVALSCNTDVKILKQLNNELRKNLTPPGITGYSLKVPAGSRELVAKNLSLVHPVVSTSYKTHKISRGDTLTSICRRYHLNKTTLLKANNLRVATLVPGKSLRIPYQTTRYILLKKGESLQNRFAADGNGVLVLHQIKPGDTLSKIAKQYDVSPELIMQWNGLRSVHKIKAGQQLALYIDHNGATEPDTADLTAASLPRRQPEPEENDGILTLSEQKKFSPQTVPDLQAPAKTAVAEEVAITYYQVQSGDSLWTIARRFQVSALDLKKWNDLDTNTIRPGIRLVIRKS